MIEAENVSEVIRQSFDNDNKHATDLVFKLLPTNTVVYIVNKIYHVNCYGFVVNSSGGMSNLSIATAVKSFDTELIVLNLEREKFKPVFSVIDVFVLRKCSSYREAFKCFCESLDGAGQSTLNDL